MSRIITPSDPNDDDKREGREMRERESYRRNLEFQFVLCVVFAPRAPGGGRTTTRDRAVVEKGSKY